MVNREKLNKFIKSYKKRNKTRIFHVKKATLGQELSFLRKYQEFVKKYKNIDEMIKIWT